MKLRFRHYDSGAVAVYLLRPGKADMCVAELERGRGRWHGYWRVVIFTLDGWKLERHVRMHLSALDHLETKVKEVFR